MLASLLLAIVADTSPAAAQAPPELPVGQLVESVACLHDPTQTYALYLPSGYAPQRRWPILYAFDPRARGPVPTRLFRAAAERLGYIVVGSNNSRNGPWPPIAAALEAVWRDTHTRLALDSDRVYTTGMSGGNQPALVLAAQKGAGVIACAGAIEEREVTPADARFVWISLAGGADFNFDLNRKLVEALVKRGLVARLVTFDGGHSWPPEDVAARALEFVHLSAMRSGRLSPEAAFVEGYVEQGQGRAGELTGRGLADAAAEEYAALARELAGLRPVEAFDAEARRLRDTPEAKKNRKHEQKLAAAFEREIGQLFALRQRLVGGGPLTSPRPSDPASALGDALGGSDVLAARTELAARLEQIERDCQAGEVDKRVVAQRVRDGFFIETFYSGMERRNERRFEVALEFLGLCARLRPQNAAPTYELARTHAANGDRKRALTELRKAQSLGFAEAGRLEVEPEWGALRGEPAFRDILTALRTAPARAAPAAPAPQ